MLGFAGIGRFLRLTVSNIRLRIAYEDFPSTQRLVAMVQVGASACGAHQLWLCISYAVGSFECSNLFGGASEGWTFAGYACTLAVHPRCCAGVDRHAGCGTTRRSNCGRLLGATMRQVAVLAMETVCVQFSNNQPHEELNRAEHGMA